MLNILKALKSPDREIKVICPDEPKHMINEITRLGLDASGTFDKSWVFPHYNGGYYNFFDLRFQKGWKYIKLQFDTVRKLICDEKPDIVMLNSMTTSWMVECIDKKIKTICFDRETFAKKGKGYRNKMIKRWLGAMTKSVFLCPFDKENAGSDHNSIIITDKVDMSRFDSIMNRSEAREKLGLHPDKRYILYVGGMWKLKGSHVALEAMRYLDKGYGLIFLQYTLGKRQLGTRDKVKKMLGLDYEGDTIKLLRGIEDRVFFFPPQKDMVPFYAASDIVIFPSTLAHQALPVYEAGAAYRPVSYTHLRAHETGRNRV
jgi:glycosyltransferase involved in cell wall biosynthesis